MADSLYVIASGAVARQRQLEAIANNLANADTSGFKADRVLFRAALDSALRSAEGEALAGAPGHTFAATRGAGMDFSRGPVERTGAPLDAALEGPGFFAVDTPRGVRYTRAGSFSVDADGQLRTASGHPVLGEGGRLVAGNRPVEIRPDGTLVDDRGTTRGRLRIVEFEEPSRLVKEGDSLFRAPPAAVDLPAPEATVLPGALEGSNVSPMREMASMMTLQREFEASLRALRQESRATQQLIQEIMQ